MVLDTIEGDTFVFKNTYEKKKQVKVPMDDKDAPDEFFFVHIKLAPGAPSSIKTRSSFASMLQTSCICFIRQCHQQGLINEDKKEKFEEYIMEEEVHSKIRKQMLTLVPNSSYIDGNCQTAYLREIISRVRPSCT